jgi:prepilin-type N-terminal cleavage/methylation domain-containing protein
MENGKAYSLGGEKERGGFLSYLEKSKKRRWKKMCRKLRSNKGFTLLEVIIVVVIIAILAAMIIPKFSITKSEATNSRDASDTHIRTLVNILVEGEWDTTATANSP